MTIRNRAISKYTKYLPTLNWDFINNDAMIYSGWHPLIRPKIYFGDESKMQGMMWFVIEMRKISVGFFFIQNEFNQIDLIYRIKHLFKKEYRIVYSNCKYFGMESEIIVKEKNNKTYFNKESKFIISNDNQDKAIKTIMNFCNVYLEDFCYIVDIINNFIQKTLFKNNLIPQYIHAFPLLQIINRQYNKHHDIVLENSNHNADVEFVNNEIICYAEVIGT